VSIFSIAAANPFESCSCGLFFAWIGIRDAIQGRASRVRRTDYRTDDDLHALERVVFVMKEGAVARDDTAQPRR
jgi:hypothetical protein